MATACVVPGCDRPHRARGYCRLHSDRLRRGVPLDAPADPRPRRRSRSHREALADLSARLERLGVCENREQAIQLVVLLVSAWPTVDPGLLGMAEPVLASELVEYDRFPP